MVEIARQATRPDEQTEALLEILQGLDGDQIIRFLRGQKQSFFDREGLANRRSDTVATAAVRRSQRALSNQQDLRQFQDSLAVRGLSTSGFGDRLEREANEEVSLAERLSGIGEASDLRSVDLSVSKLNANDQLNIQQLGFDSQVAAAQRAAAAFSEAVSTGPSGFDNVLPGVTDIQQPAGQFDSIRQDLADLPDEVIEALIAQAGL